jgi:hypothetical protein
MPNYGYHLARAQGRFVQAAYQLFLPFVAARKIQCTRNVPIDVFSYSGRRRLAEQVASIRSFLKNAGRPNRFVVVSDGSYSAEDIALLRRVDQCVSVEQVPEPPANASVSLASYLRTHPTGKQLALIMSLPRGQPALYTDSDVLFFAAAPGLENYASSESAPAYYLQDCGFAGDERILRDGDQKSAPVNTGVLLVRQRLDWSMSIKRFAQLQGDPTFFTNQTLTHLSMHANGAQPFDPAKYVLQLDDQFIYADHYAGPDLVLRHYVDPVRHKFWANLYP